MLVLSPELRNWALTLAPIFLLFAGIFIPIIIPRLFYLFSGQRRGPGPRRPPRLLWIVALMCLVLGVASQLVAGFSTSTQDDSSFVYDETIPDDTQLLPGQSFVKTWRLYNKGTTDWKNYEARRIDNLSTGTFGASGIRVDDTPAKHDALVTKEMFAPATPGCYRAVYRLFNGQGLFGERFYVQIVVMSPQVRDYVLFVDDLNVRDYTLFKPSESFRKGWMLHNCGTNTWVNYKVKRVSGNLPGSASIPVPVTAGNQNVAIWADFTAPPIQTPQSTAVYQLQDASGHPIINGEFYVTIKTEPSE